MLYVVYHRHTLFIYIVSSLFTHTHTHTLPHRWSLRLNDAHNETSASNLSWETKKRKRHTSPDSLSGPPQMLCVALYYYINQYECFIIYATYVMLWSFSTYDIRGIYIKRDHTVRMFSFNVFFSFFQHRSTVKQPWNLCWTYIDDAFVCMIFLLFTKQQRKKNPLIITNNKINKCLWLFMARNIVAAYT